MNNLIFWNRKIGIVKDHQRAKEMTGGKVILTKRRKFVLVSIILSLLLYAVQRLPVENRYPAILGMGLISYLLTSWALIKDLRGIAWVSNLILPVLFPVSVALFYFLLPQSIITRIVVLVLFTISMYGLLLTTNIFAVASIRTIQLLRAARTVGFLLSVLTSAFLFHVIFSFNLPYYMVGLATLIVNYLIFIGGVWSYSLSSQLNRDEWTYINIGAWVVTQVSIALCFFLIDAPLSSIVLSMMVYVLLGIFQHNMEKRLFARTAQEYLGFALIVLLVAIYSTLARWMS